MKLFRTAHALVAQLDRVSDYESEGQGFESLPARQKKGIRVSECLFCCLQTGTRTLRGRAAFRKRASGTFLAAKSAAAMPQGRKTP